MLRPPARSCDLPILRVVPMSRRQRPSQRAHSAEVGVDQLEQPAPTTGSSVSGPAMAARAAAARRALRRCSRPAAISTRVDATSRSPAVSRRRIAWASCTSRAAVLVIDAGLVAHDLLLDVGRREVELDRDHPLTSRVLQVLEHALVAGVVRHDEAEVRARRRARRRAGRSGAGGGGRRAGGSPPWCPVALRRPRRGSRSRPSRTARVNGPSTHAVSPPSSRKRPTRSAVVRSSWHATVMSGRPRSCAIASTNRVLPQPVGPFNRTDRCCRYAALNTCSSSPTGT